MVERWTFRRSTHDAYVGGNGTSISPHVVGSVAQILVTGVRPSGPAVDILIYFDDRVFQAAVDRATAIVGQ
jgi:multidrug resistance efflux pump